MEHLCEWHWGPSRPCMRSMAEDLLRTRTGDVHANLGVNWPDRFLRRQPGLKATWSEAHVDSRAAAAEPANIAAWLEKLWAHCDADNLDPAREGRSGWWHPPSQDRRAQEAHLFRSAAAWAREQGESNTGRMLLSVRRNMPSSNHHARYRDAARLGEDSDSPNR